MTPPPYSTFSQNTWTEKKQNRKVKCKTKANRIETGKNCLLIILANLRSKNLCSGQEAEDEPHDSKAAN